MMRRHEIETDFLVAGGGMAGVCAALAAARRGAKVVLVQDRSVLGGNASSEVRMHIVGADCHGTRKGTRESGLIEELRLEDAVRNPTRCYPLWDVILYEKVVAEPNITLLLDTDVVGVEMAEGGRGRDKETRRQGDKGTRRQGDKERGEMGRMYEFGGERGRIAAVRAVRNITEDEFVIRARVFADCTGDGRLGFEAGADFRIGRESKQMHGESLAQDRDDDWTLGSSILLTSRQFDHPVPFVPPPWARKFSPEQLTFARRIRSWEYGFWWVEWGGDLDTIKDNTTTIRHELYRIALGLWDYIKNSGHFPSSANWALDWIGAIPGKRESRRFLGPHILTDQDILGPTGHEDEVAYGGWSIDLHPPRGIDAVEEPPSSHTEFDHLYGIPLRCYFSRNIENLFFAGRNISATHVAFASTRVMATCAVGGEAVGFAAARCVRESLMPAGVVSARRQMRALQQEMLGEDVTLLNVRPEPVGNHVHSARLTASSEGRDCPIERIRDGLTRDELDAKTGELVRAHGWRSGPMQPGRPEWVQLEWAEPVEVRRIDIWFDTGFQRQLTLSASDYTSATTVRGPQPETVRRFAIEVNGETILSVDNNHQRKFVHVMGRPVRARSMRLVVHEMDGIEEARVFELRVSG